MGWESESCELIIQVRLVECNGGEIPLLRLSAEGAERLLRLGLQDHHVLGLLMPLLKLIGLLKRKISNRVGDLCGLMACWQLLMSN